jgi:uncharacterized protein YndB with AHSA1/START domain
MAGFRVAFHDSDEIGPKMLARIGKRTGLRAEDVQRPLEAGHGAGDVQHPESGVPRLSPRQRRTLAVSGHGNGRRAPRRKTQERRTMPDILHDLPIRADARRVFEAVTSPAGLDRWWTLASSGEPVRGTEYALDFGPGYRWRARVTQSVPDAAFELELVRADADWTGTRVGVELEPREGATWLRFRHTGWQETNEHYRVSSCCWAAYLRILRRYLEHGETVPYERRLDA